MIPLNVGNLPSENSLNSNDGNVSKEFASDVVDFEFLSRKPLQTILSPKNRSAQWGSKNPRTFNLRSEIWKSAGFVLESYPPEV